MLVHYERTDQGGQRGGDDDGDSKSGELVPSNMTWVDVCDGAAKMSRLYEISSMSFCAITAVRRNHGST